MTRDLYLLIPSADVQEMEFLKNITATMDDEEFRRFISIYQSRRVDPQLILLLAAIGLLGVSGIHRFYIGQVGMGILYFLTAGLCFIGTIVDMVNYKNLAFEYNRQKAEESRALIS